MADAIPTPAGAPPPPQAQGTVIVEKPMTQWQALKEAGWWTVFDWIMLAVILVMWIVSGFWFLFHQSSPEGTPKLLVLLAVLMASIMFKLIWLISLVFRCSWFVLKAHADIAMLPNASARIAVAYLSGQK